MRMAYAGLRACPVPLRLYARGAPGGALPPSDLLRAEGAPRPGLRGARSGCAPAHAHRHPGRPDAPPLRRRFQHELDHRPHWSCGLLRETSRVLLDKQAKEDHLVVLRESIEADSTDRVTDLHIWSIGHGIFAAEIAVVSDDPKTPGHYKSLIPSKLKIVHATIEVHRCTER